MPVCSQPRGAGTVSSKNTFGNLNGLLKGHGESEWTKLRGEEAQHSWVFVRRDALDSEDPENIAGLVINSAWGADAHPGDVILLTRLYISDPESHGVEVCLPAEKLALLLRGGPDYMSDRNALTNRHCNEFMKTAPAMEKFPLNMKRGSEYLRTLVRESMIIESGGDPPPWQLPPLGGWSVATQMQKMALTLTSARLTLTWLVRWIRICGLHGHR